MDCEVCGKTIYGKWQKIIIDGANLTVCSECSKFATSTPQIHRQQETNRRIASRTPKIRTQRSVSKEKIVHEDLTLVENYNILVRKAREKMGLTHQKLGRKIGEKVSILQKLETGKIVPDQVLIKKIEYALKIKLLQPSSKFLVEEEFIKKPFELTLGAIVSIHPKKSEDAEEN